MSIVDKDGLLEHRVMPRQVGVKVPVGTLGFPGQEGRQDVAPLVDWPPFAVCGPLEYLQVHLDVVVQYV